MKFRTDRHNNPCAITTDIAKQAGLVLGKEYEVGDQFVVGNKSYWTARILGDPVKAMIKVIDKISFYTKAGGLRWTYIAIPDFIWADLTFKQKKSVVGFCYKHEGGAEMKDLFI